MGEGGAGAGPAREGREEGYTGVSFAGKDGRRLGNKRRDGQRHSYLYSIFVHFIYPLRAAASAWWCFPGGAAPGSVGRAWAGGRGRVPVWVVWFNGNGGLGGGDGRGGLLRLPFLKGRFTWVWAPACAGVMGGRVCSGYRS